MITPTILLNMDSTARTGLCMLLEICFRGTVLGTSLLPRAVLRARESFMHRHLASCAVTISAGVALEDMASFVYDPVLAVCGWTFAVLWIGAQQGKGEIV